jgi:hypothetical protein
MGVLLVSTTLLTCDSCGKREVDPQFPARMNNWFTVFRGGYTMFPGHDPDAIFCLECMHKIKNLYDMKYSPAATKKD